MTMQKKKKNKKKVKPNEQKNKSSPTKISDSDANGEEEITKDRVESNKEWAMKRNRTNYYTSD